MNQPEHDDLIRDYLLGALPEEEASRFEERYLEDESLFAELQEIEDELIDDYASGALPAEQRALFEGYFLDSSERREKLELARAMTTRAIAWKQEQEAKQSAPTIIGQATANSDETTSSKVLRFTSQVRVPSWFQWSAMAASVLFAVAAGALWFNNRELRRQLIAQGTMVEESKKDAETFSREKDEAKKKAVEAEAQVAKVEEEKRSLLERLPEEINKPVVNIVIDVYYAVTSSKGESDKRVKTLVFPSNARQVQLSLNFPKSDFSKFQALLRRADRSSVGSPHVGLKARTSGEKQMVTFTAPAKSLPAGDYEVIVSGVTPDGQTEGVGRYYLHVVRR
jgi:anti-sigma-K factor RskA